MDSARYLIVTADDFGIGPATTQGILDLAAVGHITATVLLVNSPHTEDAVRNWHRAGRPIELGWHPCLTLDRPVLSPACVPTLVDGKGRFWPLGRFLLRLRLGRIVPAEIEAELRAQYLRFTDLVGGPPTLVNSHHHVQVFPPVDAALANLLQRHRPLPYFRNVCEPWQTLSHVSGARVKRLVLSFFGRRNSRQQRRLGFPGNDWLIGITDPPYVCDPDFFVRWLRRVPGQVVELTCHPGEFDPTLIGRDCTATDGQVERRARESQLLQQPAFGKACEDAGFTLVSPSQLRALTEQASHAA